MKRTQPLIGLSLQCVSLVGQSRTRDELATSILFGAVLLSICCASAFSQNNISERGSAGELLRRVITNELKTQSNDHSHWMYEVRTQDHGKERVKWIVETGEGNLDRWWSLNGRLISEEQQNHEDERIQSMLHRPDQRKKQERAREEDARQTERLFKMLPEAVNASYGDHKGNLVEIIFRPNPSFHPSSHEAAVFHAMEGRILVDERENRLVEIEGRLIRPVKFYGGLLGHLEQGGKFHVKQSDVGAGHWEITLLQVNMHGKALFFKTISVQQNESRSNFQRVPDNMTLAQAADELQKRCTSQIAASNGSHSHR